MDKMPTAAELIEKYIQLRDHLKKLTDEFEERTETYRTSMTAIEGVLLDEINRLGGQSIKTPYGTAYRSTTVSAKVVDRDAWFDFIFENKHRDMLTTHVAKDAVKDWMETSQKSPPGLDLTPIMKCNIRKPTE